MHKQNNLEKEVQYIQGKPQQYNVVFVTLKAWCLSSSSSEIKERMNKKEKFFVYCKWTLTKAIWTFPQPTRRQESACQQTGETLIGFGLTIMLSTTRSQICCVSPAITIMHKLVVPEINEDWYFTASDVSRRATYRVAYTLCNGRNTFE